MEVLEGLTIRELIEQIEDIFDEADRQAEFMSMKIIIEELDMSVEIDSDNYRLFLDELADIDKTSLH